MRRVFSFTELEFIELLQRAIRDDEKWPNLHRVSWIIEHAHSQDGRVTLTIDDDRARVIRQ